MAKLLKLRFNRILLERAEALIAISIISCATIALNDYFDITLIANSEYLLGLYILLLFFSFFSSFVKTNLKAFLEGTYAVLMCITLITAFNNKFNVTSYFLFLFSILFTSSSSRNEKIFTALNTPLVVLFFLEYVFYNYDLVFNRTLIYLSYFITFLSGLAITKIRSIVLSRSKERNLLLAELFNSSKSALILYNVDKKYIKDINSNAESLFGLKRKQEVSLADIHYKERQLFSDIQDTSEYTIDTKDDEILKVSIKNIKFKKEGFFLITIDLYDSIVDLSNSEEFKKIKEISNDAYYNLYESNDSLLIIVNEECEILDLNNTFLKSLGISSKSMAILRSVNEFIAYPKDQLNKTKVLEYTHQNQPKELEFRYKDRSIYLELLISKGKFLEQEVFILNGRNVTEKMILQEELKVFHERYRYVTNESSIGFLAADLEGFIVEANQSFCDFLGYSKEEMLKLHIRDIAPEKETSITLDLRKKLINGEIKSSEVIKKYKRKDGTLVYAIFTLLLQKDLNNKPKYFFAQIVDISEIKKAQKELEVSEESYRKLFNNSEELLYILNKDNQFIDVNNAVLEKYGYSKEEILGQTPLIFSAPDLNDIEEVLHGMSEVWNDKKFNTLWWSIKKDGTIFPKKLRFKKGLYKNQEVLIATGIDISESYEYENKLKEEERRYRNLYERNLAGVYRSNKEGDVLECNPAYLEILGYKKADYKQVKLNVKAFYLSDDERKRIIEKIEEQGYLKDEKLNLKKKDDSIITVLLNSTAIKNEAGETVYYEGNLIDITKQELIEIELKKSQQEYYKLINSSAFGIIILHHGNIVFSNQKACNILGYSSIEEVLEKEPFDILLEEESELYKKQFDELRSNIEIPFSRYVIKKKNGFLIDVEGKPSTIEYEGKNSILFSFIDISDKKKIKEVEEKIIATEKFNSVLKSRLKEKEVLLKEVHHRVKNNMQIIYSILNLQLSFVKEESIVNIIKDSQNRIGSMAQIHEMLYSTKDFSSLRFDEYLLNLASKLLSTYESKTTSPILEHELNEVVLTIDQAIPCGLIVNELISNALKYAFSDQKVPKIKLSLAQEEEVVKMVIKDNGIGLPNNFSLKNLNSLGLQLVDTLVHQLGGKIEIESMNGASFTIIFNRIA